MSTLYIDRKNLELRIEGNTLAFYCEQERNATMPLNIIERLCIKGELKLSASVLGKLGEHGIAVIVISGRERKPTIFLPNARQDAFRRLAQAHFSQDETFALHQSREWVAEKIHRQHRHLEKRAAEQHIAHNTLHHEMQQLEKAGANALTAENIAILRGIEGKAAAVNFAALAKCLPASLNFNGRNRNPPRDPYNVVLSLSYTLLHFEMVKQIHMIGLDPCIGFYHSLMHSRESLACDLIEPLRPLIDEWSIKCFRERTLRIEDFSIRGNACHMGKSARARYYPAFEIAAKEWRKEMRSQCFNLLKKLGEYTMQNPQMRKQCTAASFTENEEIIWI